MASLEQIGAALKRAAAAGDTAAATKLASAYKAMQAQQTAQPEAPGMMDINARFAAKRAADPVTAEYNMALQQVRELYPQMTEEQFQTFVNGKKSSSPMAPIGNLPVVGGILAPGTGDTPGVGAPLTPQQITQNDQLFGFGDEIGAGASTLADMTRGVDPRASYAAWERLNRARRAKGIQDAGGVGTAASIVGQLTSIGPGKVAPLPASLPKTYATNGATGAGLGWVEGFGSTDGDLGQRVEGANRNAIVGGLTGLGTTAALDAGGRVVNRFANNRAVDAAVRNAPDSGDLSTASRALFQKVDNSGVTVDTNRFSRFVNDMIVGAKQKRINPNLDPKSYEAYRELIGALGDVQSTGKALSLSDLHTLRQIAQRAAVSSEGRDAMFANRIVEGLDKFITQTGALKYPPGRLGAGNAAGDLSEAISTWGRARRVALIEDAIEKAQNYSSGVESGLRAQFRSLLNNKSTRKLFTAQEVRALKAVVNGTAPIAALRTLGIFRGLGGAVLGSLFGGPLGTVVGGVAGIGGRKITENATMRAAERAGKIAAMPNVPNIPYTPRRLPATPLPLLFTGG